MRGVHVYGRATRMPVIPVMGALLGCWDHSSPSHAWVVERSGRAGGILVRTISGSVWGRPMTLVEDMRTSAFETPEEGSLGPVQAMAVDSSGGIFVFGFGGPALRYFDSTGRYVRTLGGTGSGPGEYQDVLLGLAVRRDGRLMARDPRNARLSLYNPDGTPSDSWPVASGLQSAQAMTLDTADHVYLTIRVGEIEPNKAWPIGLLHLDAAGRIVDTIPTPTIVGEPALPGRFPFPSKLWAFGPYHAFVIGMNDRYSFEIRRPGQRPVLVERAWRNVRLEPAERGEWETVREWAMKNIERRSMRLELPPTPRTKPAYRGLTIGTDGRIWVRLHTRAVKDSTIADDPRPGGPPVVTWQEPAVYDVFEEDGTYLGEVRAPSRTTLMVRGRDRVWGVRQDRQGKSYVTRFRIVPAA